MIDGSEKRNRQLAFEIQSHVCEKRSNVSVLLVIWALKLLQSSVAMDCKDGHWLKLEKNWADLIKFYCNA